MEKEKVYVVPNQITPNKPVIFNETFCKGCNICVETCSMDVFMPNPEKGKPPFVVYPDECMYCGSCVDMCPPKFEGAIRLEHPLMQKVRWKRKETGEHFRIGMPDPPPPNKRPPVGGWYPKA